MKSQACFKHVRLFPREPIRKHRSSCTSAMSLCIGRHKKNRIRVRQATRLCSSDVVPAVVPGGAKYLRTGGCSYLPHKPPKPRCPERRTQAPEKGVPVTGSKAGGHVPRSSGERRRRRRSKAQGGGTGNKTYWQHNRLSMLIAPGEIEVTEQRRQTRDGKAVQMSSTAIYGSPTTSCKMSTRRQEMSPNLP